MNDVLKFGKKLFTASVVGVTIAWSMGLAALVPAVAQAATCPELEAGDLFKAPNASAVYFLTANMERAYFPHEEVFKSWNLSFSDVKTIDGSCLFTYPVASPAGIDYRAGSRLVKLTDAPAVFAITPGNKIVQIGSEAVAAALYGTNWAKLVRDISPFHWSNYTDSRTTWNDSKPHDGQFVKKTGETTVYMVKDGALHKVDGANVPDVREVSASTFAMLSVAGDTVTLSSAFENPTQVDGSAPAPSSGALTVALASNTAASRIIPAGAQGVDYLAFTVRAGSSAGTLDQVTLKRAGIGSKSDFSKIYLYKDGVRLDNGRSLNNDDEVTFNVNTTIAANSTATFWVKADMDTLVGDGTDATSGDQNYFEITTASDVESAGTVGGSFPVRGNSITLGAQDIGTLTVTAEGSDSSAKIGQNSVVVSEFNVEASTADDVEITGITLKQKGTAPTSVLTNVKLMQGGTTVAQGVVTGDWVKFDFSQKVSIKSGDNKRFKVYADLGIADTNDTVKLVLDEKADVMAYSVDFPGSLAGVTNAMEAADVMVVTVEGGKINVDLAGTNADVRPDQNDAVFGTFSVLATAENVDVDTMTFVLHKSGGNYCPDNLRLRDKSGKGSYSLEPTSACVAGDSTKNFTVENMSLTKGTAYEFEIVGDVGSDSGSDAVTVGDQYYFTWAASSVDATGATSDNAVATNDFSSASLTGPTMTVNPSSLVVRATALSNEQVVNGAKNVLLYRGTLEAGSTSDVTLTSLEAIRNAGSAAWDDLLDGMKLYVSKPGVAVNTATDFVANDNTVSDERALFSGFNVTVKKGSANKVNFEIYVDTTNGSTTGDVKISVDSIDATDEDSQDVAAKNGSGAAISGAPVVSDRLLTIAGSGTLAAVIDTNYTGLRNDFYVLAGTQKQLAGRVQLRATNEDVKLKDLVIFATSTDAATSSASVIEDTFDSITVYEDAAMTKPLATTNFAGGTLSGVTTTLEDVNFVVPADTTKYLYFGLNVNSIGTGDNGTATSGVHLKLRVSDSGTTAEGISSKSDLSASDIVVTESTYTKLFTVIGSQVTNVATSFAGGNLAGGEQVFFTFSVTADSGSNTDVSGDTLDLLLTRVKLQLSSDVNSVTSTKLCKVSTGDCINIYQTTPVSSTPAYTAGEVNVTSFYTPGAVGYVDLTGFANTDDRRVGSGETVLYEVRGTFTGVTDSFAQGSLQDLDNSGLVWGYDLDNNNVVDFSFYDLMKMEPRPSGYPDVTGGALN